MEQFWNFPAIEACAGEVHGYSGAVAGLLEEGAGSLVRLSGAWGGTASGQYQQIQTKWNNASDELNAALQNLGQTISEAGQSMLHTDLGIGNSFGQ